MPLDDGYVNELKPDSLIAQQNICNSLKQIKILYPV